MNKQLTLTPTRWEDCLFGVIDLVDAVAVHGVKGERSKYAPIPFCEGDANALTLHYFSLGIRSAYVADLDAIQGGEAQWEQYEQLLRLGFDRLMIDLGWRSDLLSFREDLLRLNEKYPEIQWVVATETCQHVEAYCELIAHVGAERVCLSLDFSNGRFLNQSSDWQSWVDCSQKQLVHDLIVLDLAAVGSQNGGATSNICRQIKCAWPSMRIYTGGGIRFDADIELLLDAGCHAVLAATALYPSDSSKEIQASD